MFIGEIGEQAYQVRDNSVEMRSWLNFKGVAQISQQVIRSQITSQVLHQRVDQGF
jgi:hypothetical protein